jgi:hypothetical protein
MFSQLFSRRITECDAKSTGIWKDDLRKYIFINYWGEAVKNVCFVFFLADWDETQIRTLMSLQYFVFHAMNLKTFSAYSNLEAVYCDHFGPLHQPNDNNNDWFIFSNHFQMRRMKCDHITAIIKLTLSGFPCTSSLMWLFI